MLSNKRTDACMVADADKKLHAYEECYSVTSSPNITGPISRAIFIIERADENDGYPDNIVHLGQHVKFTSNPYFHPRKLYLKSTAQSPLKHSEKSRFQEVYCSAMDSFDTSWVMEACDPNVRFEMNGEQVLANGPIVIKHASTGHFLASDLSQVNNNYGKEFEVNVHSYATLNKS